MVEKEASLEGKRPPSPVEGGGSASVVVREKQCYHRQQLGLGLLPRAARDWDSINGG